MPGEGGDELPKLYDSHSLDVPHSDVVRDDASHFSQLPIHPLLIVFVMAVAAMASCNGARRIFRPIPNAIKSPI
jgi:hypothetical protein